MTDSPHQRNFSAQLLRQDSGLTETPYKEYRMQLEQTLTIAERREKITLYVAGISGVLAFGLMIVPRLRSSRSRRARSGANQSPSSVPG